LVPYNNQAHQVVPLTPNSLSSLYQQNNSFNTQNPTIGQYYNSNIYYNNYQPETIQRFPMFPIQNEIANIPNYSTQQNFFQPQYFPQYRAKSEEIVKKPEPVLPQAPTPTPPINHYLPMTKAPSTSGKSEVSIVPSIPGPSSGLKKVSSAKRTDNLNLIDLDVDDSPTDILESFDPLTTPNRTSREDAENSFYSDYDPFEYIYSGNTTYSDPVYDAVVKNDLSSPKQSADSESIYQATTSFPTNIDHTIPPPLPPRNSDPTSRKNSIYSNFMPGQSSSKLYENVVMTKNYDKELIAFYNMVKELRGKYKNYVMRNLA
jgi:hypothetical protein